MVRKFLEDMPWLSPLPFTALSIGQWEDDVTADRIRGDAVMARLFGLTEDELAEGVTLARLLSLFHPEDRNGETDHRRRVRAAGGVFAWEHRVLVASGEVRWLLARGQFARDPDGRVRGRGVVIDMTDVRGDEHGGETMPFLIADRAGPPLERMANRVLEAWEGRDAIGVVERDRLRPLFEALLMELGRQVVASSPRGVEREGGPPPQAGRVH